jgi:mono/diheme cytochrome c family protein
VGRHSRADQSATALVDACAARELDMVRDLFHPVSVHSADTRFHQRHTRLDHDQGIQGGGRGEQRDQGALPEKDLCDERPADIVRPGHAQFCRFVGQGDLPVLADDDWLYGGDFDTIVETITNGRQGFMPAHEGMLDEATIDKLADFVIAASQGKATPAQFTLFNDNGCGGCHGDNARGGALNNLGTGAANLTDGIWRFGGKREDILRTIKYGVNQDNPKTRVAIMPAFGGKLSPETIKMLAVKVHEFGGGQ